MIYQVLALGTHVFEGVMIKVEFTLHHVRDDFQLVPTWEGDFAREQDVEDDSHGPQIDFRGVVLLKNFGSNVIGL